MSTKEGTDGAYIVIYNDMGSLYYLILHTVQGRWELLKSVFGDQLDPAEGVLQAVRSSTGLNTVQLKGTLGEHVTVPYNGSSLSLDVYLIEANMNSPINIRPQKNDNYLWSTRERVIERLTYPQERDLIQRTEQFLKRAG